MAAECISRTFGLDQSEIALGRFEFDLGFFHWRVDPFLHAFPGCRLHVSRYSSLSVENGQLALPSVELAVAGDHIQQDLVMRVTGLRSRRVPLCPGGSDEFLLGLV